MNSEFLPVPTFLIVETNPITNEIPLHDSHNDNNSVCSDFPPSLTNVDDNASVDTMTTCESQHHELNTTQNFPKEQKTVCDACPFCEDVCGCPLCITCCDKMQRQYERCEPCNKSFTMCQVRRHNDEESAWLIAGKVVYDATPYIRCHPGGKMSIMKFSGGAKDCTDDMNFHSKKAIRAWKKNRVGQLRRCTGNAGFGQAFPGGEEGDGKDMCCIS